jgi:hypothetical protein
VDDTPDQQIHRRDAEILAAIGREAEFREVGDRRSGGLRRWTQRTPRHRQLVEVHLPEHLARAAVDAWQQRDSEEVAPESESPRARAMRQRAWTLALLGSVVNERGRTDGGEVVVALSGDVVDAAVAAANRPLG